MEEGGEEVTPPGESPADLLGHGVYAWRGVRGWGGRKSAVRQPSSTTNSRSDTAAELRNGSRLPTCPYGSFQPLGENVI